MLKNINCYVENKIYVTNSTTTLSVLKKNKKSPYNPLNIAVIMLLKVYDKLYVWFGKFVL